jgi:hypothetical protein
MSSRYQATGVVCDAPLDVVRGLIATGTAKAQTTPSFSRSIALNFAISRPLRFSGWRDHQG